MKRSTWKTYALWILLSEGVGALSGWLTREGLRVYPDALARPALSPPAAVFPVVWVLLFALMGAGAARVALSPSSPARSRGLRLFLVQLAVNFFWSLLFFNRQAFGLAFLWLLLLWFLILRMILVFRAADPPAALLQIPYLLWVTFAAYLNLGVWLLNRSSAPIPALTSALCRFLPELF